MVSQWINVIEDRNLPEDDAANDMGRPDMCGESRRSKSLLYSISSGSARSIAPASHPH